jgi:hypothetical protein
VPSPPATDDGSARPLTEDQSTGSGDGDDITSEADSAEAGEVPAAAGAEPRDGEAGAGPEMAGPDSEAEFTEDDVSFLSVTQEADATIAANVTVTEGAPGPDAAPAIGESGRWFRPVKAKKKYVPIPPEDQAGSAGPDVAPADPEPGGAEATQDRAEPDGAMATQEPPEQAAELAAGTLAGPAEVGAEVEAEAEAGGG